jgi:competence protein ComEC
MRSSLPVSFNAYPALLCALAVAVGIVAGDALSFRGGVVAAGGACLAAGAGLCWPPSRLVSPRPLLWTLTPLLALAALGAARLQQDRALPPSHVGHLVERFSGDEPAVVLEGRIRAPPRRSRRATRFRVAARRVFAPTDTARTAPLPVTGTVEVTLRPSAWDAPEAPFPPVTEGDLVQLRGELRAPPGRRNPADFDYGAYLRRRGVYATMSVYEPAHVVIAGRRRTALEKLVVPARHHVERQLARHVPSSEARAVLRALLLGDRSSLPGATEQRFVRSGLMHLLAVSGLHVLLVGWLFYQVLRPPLLRLGFGWHAAEWLRSALTLLVLVLYVLLAGAPASATRAALMAALLMGATLAQRPTRSLNALGAAAALLLMWRPAQLFEAGFQLSFAAVGAIVVLMPVMGRALPSRWEEHPARQWVARSTLTTLAATLGTLPVLLAHFGRVPFAGLLLNLWAIPLTAVALAGGLTAVLFGGWAGLPAGAAGATADLAVQALLWTAHAGDAVAAWTVLRVPETGPWLLAGSMAFMLVLAAWPRPRWRWRFAAVALALAVAGCWHSVLQERRAPVLDAFFLDVGHGDAVLLSLPGGAHVLVDAGGRSPGSDAARAAILPHLEQRGIERLDAVVLSHPDGDHLGGLPTLLRSVDVGRLVTGGDTTHSALFAETGRLVDSLRVPVRVARAGDTLRLGTQVKAHVLAPTARLVERASENDASLVFQLTHDAVRFLFTGDAEANTERLLSESYGPLLQSDVVKIGHHSSKTSSILPFVQAAAGREGAFAVASSGRRFGLPNRTVLSRWRKAGVQPLATADEGAVWLRSDGRRVRFVRWRE